MTRHTEWSWHGGALELAQRRFPDAPQPWIDLSTGINPHGWPVPHDLAIDWQRLPEAHQLMALEAQAAQYFGVDPCYVCAVPGTEMAMRLIGAMIGPAGQYGLPAYRTHSEIFAQATAAASLDEADAGQPLIFANPANPDGRLLKRSALLALLDQRAMGWTMIDEAYADTDPKQSVADQIDERRRIILLRSFGKFFGLAGVRLGFVLAPTALLQKLRHAMGAWPISSAAIAIGRAAYSDHRWIADARTQMHAAAMQLDALLAAQGLITTGACPLYRLIISDKAAPLFDQLAQQAILTRPFDDHPNWLRIGLPADRLAFDRLAEALAGD